MAMPRSALVVTRMDGPEDSHATELLNPTWVEIEAAIRRLNGQSCTLVCLGIGSPPVPHMSIGGGEEDRYVVYIPPDNAIFNNLIQAGAPKGKCLLKAGAQFGDYDLKLCVSLAEALRAAKTYAETDQTDPNLTWEIQR